MPDESAWLQSDQFRHDVGTAARSVLSSYRPEELPVFDLLWPTIAPHLQALVGSQGTLARVLPAVPAIGTDDDLAGALIVVLVNLFAALRPSRGHGISDTAVRKEVTRLAERRGVEDEVKGWLLQALPELYRMRASMQVASAQDSSSDLEEGLTRELLGLIHATGRSLERLPRTYEGRAEEALRDQFIVAIEPRCKATVVAEAVNSAGKTDILIRQGSRNLLVVEFKFWDGAKKHLGTIEQLLSYLTWRDGEAAIVYFVQQQAIVRILRTIEETTREHPCYQAFRGQPSEGWLDYGLHLPGDPERPVHLAVLCFHFPEALS